LRRRNIEDWLLIRWPAIIFTTIGSLCAIVLALMIPSFDNTNFAIAYGFLATAAAFLALIATGRTTTVMKFEIGPRFLNIPRLLRVSRLAMMLVLPCLLFQILYPSKIVYYHRLLMDEDIKAMQHLGYLYYKIGHLDPSIQFPLAKGA
jgi:hypothetical protein